MSDSYFRGTLLKFSNACSLWVGIAALLLTTNSGLANSIGDFVWDDMNTNGVQDVGEPGLAGIPISLFDPSSNFVAATSTDVNGFYEFTNIVNGTYFIRFLPFPSFPYYLTTNDAGGNDDFDSDVADATGLSPTFNYTGTAITNIDAGYVIFEPDIGITKIASDGVTTAADGEILYVTNNTVVTYDYTITNSGNSYLSFVVFIDEPLFPIGPGNNPILVACPDNFGPGEVINFTTSVVINASITNVATVQAIPVDFKTCEFLALNPVEDTDDAIVIVVAPGYELTKDLTSPTNRPAAVGENVEFTVSLVNTGDAVLVSVPLVDTYDTNFLEYVSSVPASDDNVNDGTIDWTDIGPLGIGATTNVIVNFTAVQSTLGNDETNIVVAAPMTATNQPNVDPLTNSAPYEVVDPSVSIVKTLIDPTRPTALGETNTFTIVVSNTGDITLDTVPVVDTYDTSLISYINSDPASEDNTDDGTLNWTNVGPLAVGESITITSRFSALASGIGTNFVQTAPTTTNGVPVPPDDDPVGFTNVNPTVSITKTLVNPSGRPAAIGETNVFTIIVSNTGDITLDTVPVVDTYDTALISYVESAPASDDNTDDGTINWADVGPLGVGANVTITSRFVALASGIGTNFVQTTPTTTNGIPVPPDDDPEGYTNVNPSVLITKLLVNPSGRPAALGETNIFRIVVLNNGDIPLDTVPLNDTYNTGLISYINSDPASDDNADDGSIDWTDLTGVGSLAVNDSIIVTTRFVAVASGVGTNLATTTPTTTNGIPVPPDDDPEGFTNVNPVVTVVKTLITPASRPAAVGETNVFTILVSNAGDIALDTVPVIDTYDTSLISYIGSDPASEDNTDDGTINWTNVGPLAVGESITITSRFVAASSGIGTNLVDVTPTTTNGIPVPPDDDPEGFTNINPSVRITKTIVNPLDRPAALGETNMFAILVENTGDVTLDTVPVEDTYDTGLISYIGAVPGSDDNNDDGTINWANVGPLSVGGSITITASFTAVASGEGTNFVTTAPTLTNSVPVPPDDDPEGFTNRNPVVTIVKTLISPTDRAGIVGETNCFSILVSNAGDVTLDTVPVVDTYDSSLISIVNASIMADINIPGSVTWSDVGPLAVGDSLTITACFEVVGAGIGTNFVSTAPTTTNGIPVPPDDDPEGYTNVTISIGDTVWIDLNTNGVADELLSVWGINGVTVNLSNTLDGTTSSTVSAPNFGQQGYYNFSGLPYGIYVVSFDFSTVPPLLAVQTTPSSYTIDPDAPGFPANGIVDDADFGFQSGSLTPIELLSFTGERIDGGVELDWETAVEFESFGFNLYRASTAYENARIRLNASPIPAVGGSDGAAYSFVDRYAAAGVGFLYWLEEVATDGSTELFGPIAVHALGAGQDNIASALIGSGGLVRIGYDALVAAGVSVNDIDPANLKVFIEGEEVASYVSTEESLLQSGDYVIFYAPPATGEREVSLANDEDGGSAMEWIYARPARGGDLGVVEVDESGSVEFDIDTAAQRMMVSGFTDPTVWVLDITDPANPAMLYGQVVVQGGDSGEYAVYFSVNPEDVRQGVAVQDDQIINLEQIRSE